ncbi:protein PFC0760c-like [Osmia bicornis bicornis]|uniref:protein PFC0760c-like n=1 Tax=Osmia bicornis bicornis TaxID=1437191 RepID=UPI0010F599C0|nr:protein PFC0760c-like [Osmia bicornis bicornis]
MCDLIDLKSPDKKGLLNSRLASPLIPVPTDSAGDNCNNRINDSIPVITSKRDSLENNPFDMVLHKTTEYIQKRDDPFEVTLEKALRLKCKKINELRTHSFDFTNDYNVKEKNHVQKLKMNKTLDEFLINEELNQKTATSNKISNENVMLDSNNVGADDVIPTINVEEVDLSILNQSLMNDTLFETDKELNKNEIAPLHNKISMQAEKDKFNIGQTIPSNLLLKFPRLQRSLSQGGNESSKKSQLFKHLSLVEALRTSSENGSNISDRNSLDFLNEGFLKHYYSGSSLFSSLSNVSSIAKLNFGSSSTSLSILSPNDTNNRAFLESCSSEKSENSRSIENTDLNKEITSVTSVPTKCTMSGLIDQFDRLKAKLSELPESLVEQKNEKCCSENKLIDVDVFAPKVNSSKECYRSSVSDTSSDSVFLDGSKVNKSIFHEAKLLAKTFEELAMKTSSGSSTDDLFSSNPLWTSELLPAFDDEDMVDNLIELPTSPNANHAESKDIKVKECTNTEICAEKDAEVVINKMTDNLKELELELIESVHKEKHITAATLLSELKKLIKTENNLEANKLVENLEKVLGIDFENNTELLTAYLNTTNNLAKSPQKSDSSLKVIQNIEKNNMEHSQEDNLSNDSDNVKESPVYKNINIDDSNINKCITNQKCLDKINSDSLKINTEETNKNRNEKELNIEIECKEDSSKKESNNLLNEKVVIELLTNIGKLLTGQTETQPTSDILKNLGKVFNVAANDDNMKIQQTPKKSKLKFEDKTHSLISSTSHRQSLNLESKKQSLHKNFIRRSISVSHTSATKDPVPITSSNNSKCQLKEVTKRFPSDPGFVSPTSNKKVVTKNNRDGLKKDAQTKSLATLDLQKETTATINTVKNKLKKKIDTEVTNKKGPMKAMLPIGTMQKKKTGNSKVTSSHGTVTPPKSHKIISSTPISPRNDCAMKRSSRSSKPVASSTPDAHNSKSRKVQSPQVAKKRNFSCDISPVSIRTGVDNKINSSPKRKLSSPKKTPKRRSVGSGIPKSQTPPLTKKLNSSFDVNRYSKLYESPQRSSYKTSNSQNSSPVSVKKNESVQQSPLRDNNKLIYKAKPMKLISKLQRHSVDTNIAEKENNYI